MKTNQYIVIDKDILGGTPVFAGTRVPVSALTDYLAAGDSLDIFLDNYPSVTRNQAQQLLALMAQNLSHEHYIG